MKSIYKRVLIKVSGEALAGVAKHGIDEDVCEVICQNIKKLVKDLGVQVAIVVGGGNFWRGAKNPNFDRTSSDHMGMLATVMNGLALADKFADIGQDAVVFSALQMDSVTPFYTRDKAVQAMNEGKVAILTGGTGRPYFTTDTGAALRAAEIEADVILLAKNIDAVYDSDPAVNPNAKKFDKIAMADVLAQNLGVMDLTATAFCFANKIPVRVFGVKQPENIVKACCGDEIGTIVTV